ncbi:MAG: aminodeoxychorismate synthase component I [Sciscionella sp.]|nr:aminodeoxychorismate synthase component I [Sciscionella sp.]
MRVRAWPIGGSMPPELVLPRLVSRARALGIDGPAALIGDWFDSAAVLAPTVRMSTMDTSDDAFAVLDRQPEIVACQGDSSPNVIGGGWIGYLGYGLTDPGSWRRRLPNAAFGFADHLLRLDHNGQWWFEALTPIDAPPPIDLLAEFTALLNRTPQAPRPRRRPHKAGELFRSPAEEHRDAVRECIDAIAAGEIFQANVCTRFAGKLRAEPVELFAAGVAAMRPAKAAYLAVDDVAVLSFSPELFLARQGKAAYSTPIKGTLPRRGAFDDHNAELLRKSAKDVAENVMITDLVRNDLGRVAEVGGVSVPRLLRVHPAPGVWHLSSTVTARLPNDLTNADLLTATFPPGSVTGAPKSRALEIIAEVEHWAREVSFGAIGMAAPGGRLELNVAIRTLQAHGDDVWLGVGGGITADSDPAAEWAEVLHKAAPIEALLRSEW